MLYYCSLLIHLFNSIAFLCLYFWPLTRHTYIDICGCIYIDVLLNGQEQPITKTIKVRRTRHAGHCWRNKDELISDILRWTPSHRRAKAGRLARTYKQQLRADTGYCLEDLPGAMTLETGGERGSGISVMAA